MCRGLRQIAMGASHGPPTRCRLADPWSTASPEWLSARCGPVFGCPHRSDPALHRDLKHPCCEERKVKGGNHTQLDRTQLRPSRDSAAGTNWRAGRTFPLVAVSAVLGYESRVETAQTCTLLRTQHAYVGLLLIAVFWPLNWLLPEETRRTSYLFFPLWLGYALTVDALVLARSGTSILDRSRRDFILLFITSAPAWWLFEWINKRTRNWEYVGGEAFSGFQYFVLATISFSTVMPAVFETAELVRTFRWTQRFTGGPRLAPTRGLTIGLFMAGLVMLTLTLLWPKYFYPLIWGAIFLLLEPLNIALGRRSLLHSLEQGDWRPVVSLSVGALICGFFWEMWNYYSYPKWIYHTPGAEFLHIFEMPLLGFLGYLPFAWELYALRNFLMPKATPLRI